MFKFNDTGILTGYIKQLLNSFNLPKLRVYNGNEKDVIISCPKTEQTNHARYIYYIKDNQVTYATSDASGKTSWKPGRQFEYNVPVANVTRNLVIKNNIYDSYTHEYLGDFLRFQRDYNNLNLMPFYNCFSNRMCETLDINTKIEVSENVSEEKEKKYSHSIVFNTADTNYKIYMLPVKLLKTYTIAIDCPQDIEICCGLYGQYFRGDKADYLIQNTYITKHGSCFSKPFIYDKLTKLDSYLAKESETELAQNEADLKMFIKVPFNSESSIVILEGDYCKFNDGGRHTYVTESGTTTAFNRNSFILNYEKLLENPAAYTGIFRPITTLQLLQMNTGTSYPFSNRLIEFLIGNTVDGTDEISDNIKRIQTIMSECKLASGIYGAWDNRIQYALYDFMCNKQNIARHPYIAEVIGYLDKDTEKYYKSLHKVTEAEAAGGMYPGKKAGDYVTIDTVADVNIYKEE